MPFIGESYTVFYNSKGRTSGLTDVKVNIKEPDNNNLGPFDMDELIDSYGSGIYGHTFTPDKLGEYLFTITSDSKNDKQIKTDFITEKPLTATNLTDRYTGVGI